MDAIKELLYRLADDELIIGHRNSEWTGLGPVLEEDISMSSMAQDKVGHALQNYTILYEEFGEPDPDKNAFLREAKEFKNCQMVELPIGEYDFSLMRHFFFDHAHSLRYIQLANSSYKPLAKLARKVKGELKYHIFHANTWVKQLGNGSEESHGRLQSALNEVFPFALGMFEPGDHEDELKKEGVFVKEQDLQEAWLDSVRGILTDANLVLPEVSSVEPVYGGRKGQHTKHLQPLLEEMGEVLRGDPAAEW